MLGTSLVDTYTIDVSSLTTRQKVDVDTGDTAAQDTVVILGAGTINQGDLAWVNYLGTDDGETVFEKKFIRYMLEYLLHGIVIGMERFQKGTLSALLWQAKDALRFQVGPCFQSPLTHMLLVTNFTNAER